MDKLWFFWGQKHMSFLRWITLLSAVQNHDNVVLVLRREMIKSNVHWKEKQDFQISPQGHNWLLDVNRLPIKKVLLEDIAPDIAKLRAPGVQTSDLLAWWVLANYGGTVADMDIVFLKPLPEIKQDVQVVVFEGSPSPGYTPVSFMQGKPCELWHTAYAKAMHSYDPENYESCGSLVLDPKPASGLSQRVVFPFAGMRPWSFWHRWLFEYEDWPDIPADCCGIHWYAGHNQKQNQTILHEGDLKDGAMAWAVQEVLKRESISC